MIGVVGKNVIVQVICVRKIGLSVINYSWPDSDQDTHRSCRTLHRYEVVAVAFNFVVVVGTADCYGCHVMVDVSYRPHRDLQSIVHLV